MHFSCLSTLMASLGGAKVKPNEHCLSAASSFQASSTAERRHDNLKISSPSRSSEKYCSPLEEGTCVWRQRSYPAKDSRGTGCGGAETQRNYWHARWGGISRL